MAFWRKGFFLLAPVVLLVGDLCGWVEFSPPCRPLFSSCSRWLLFLGDICTPFEGRYCLILCSRILASYYTISAFMTVFLVFFFG